MPSSLIDEAGGGINTPEYSVSEISGAVKRTIEGEFAHVRIRGEVGRISRPRSGHMYLDLKDDRAVLAAVCWKAVCGRLEVQPQEGDEVVATGRLTTFPGQSKYQLVIENLAYAGEGALLAKLERLKKALAAEGLFDAARKCRLPFLPRVIGVVTSPSGAVIRDILHRLGDRFPVRVLVWPVAVQGAACAPEVAAAIRGFCALPEEGPVPRPDVLIVARGGGSVEDLWGFNEESVVRAVSACTIPLISAVGHETDTTLIDFAADCRAPTPTAAAEMAVPVRAELVAGLAELDGRRARALAHGLSRAREALKACARALPRPDQILGERRQRLDIVVGRMPRPQDALARHRHRVETCGVRLPTALKARTGQARLRLSGSASRLRPGTLAERIRAARQRLAPPARRLEPELRRRLADFRARLGQGGRLLGTLGYRQTLQRGYVVVRDRRDRVLTRAGQVEEGAALELEFFDGRRSASAGEGEPRPSPSRVPARGRSDGGSSQGSLF
ncbi:MAG TPA: exodeoxyribonuclease VII large subunit [Thermohalobaculum sp.]|nr:exodeoxyribonuclease VII large subunit [Thermohalobaculum sp.]